MYGVAERLEDCGSITIHSRIMAGRRIIFRVLAACLAFMIAMVFGILAVNRYYDYYQTWGTGIVLRAQSFQSKI